MTVRKLTRGDWVIDPGGSRWYLLKPDGKVIVRFVTRSMKIAGRAATVREARNVKAVLAEHLSKACTA